MKVFSRYATSLYEIADENKKVDEVSKELEQIAKVFEDNAELFDVFSSPTVSVSDKLAILSKVFKGKISETAYSFLGVLCEKKRIDLFFEVKDEFKEIHFAEKKQIEAVITTAIEIDSKTKASLVKRLEEKTGKSVIPSYEVDKTIMGGVIVSYDNTLIDGSIKTKLLNLNKHIGK